MDEYPFIKVKGGKIRRNNTVWRGKKAVEKLQELVKTYEMVYALDLDGYKRNEPNLELYKKVRGSVWVDAFPRYVEDVMDIIVSGVERLTVWVMEERHLAELRDMCESEIFLRDDDAKNAARKAREYRFRGVILESGQPSGNTVEMWKIDTDAEVVRRVKK
ncbi:MAG: hypothetical protein DRN07_02670 [Thermoplasmata archaeon]|nr:MAG: hypothetical protein DRN07_02670 [Thermoplasmata archaeon]